jgi:hypothetical protein
MSKTYLVLGDIFVTLSVSGGAGGDGAFLLFTSLAQQDAKAFDLTFELAAIAFELGDGLFDFLVATLDFVEVLAGAVAVLGDGADFDLQVLEAFFETGDLAAEVAVVVTSLIAFTFHMLDLLRDRVDFLANLGEGGFSGGVGPTESLQLALEVETASTFMLQIVLVRVTLDDDLLIVLVLSKWSVR